MGSKESWPFPAPLATMEARRTERWPKPDGDLAYEPKWDGFRVLCWGGGDRDGHRLDSRNRKPLLRYFPELEAALGQLPAGTVVDGEVVVVIGAATRFDALQQRLHPAESRVNRLADETPARLVAFDLLALAGDDLRDQPFARRREQLEELSSTLGAPWHLTPSTTDQETGRRWFDELEPAGCDGIIVKRRDQEYRSGERAMWKIKHRRDVDVVIGGYREHKAGGKIGSLLLGLYDDEGELHFVGHCSGFPDQDRVALLEALQEWRAESAFGEHARRPGAESRWTGGKDLSWEPVRPGIVAEVSYDQLEGNRFRHATRFHRWRPDKDAAECTMDQLERPRGLGFDEVVAIRG